MLIFVFFQFVKSQNYNIIFIKKKKVNLFGRKSRAGRHLTGINKLFEFI